MRRKILIVSLVLSLIIAAIVMLWWKYGLFGEYNYFTAKRDIKNGNIRLLGYGLPIVTSKDGEMDMIRAKYGFKDCNLGCSVTNEDLRTTEIYNSVVEEYLTKRNGNGWEVTYRREIDSLYKIAFDQDK